jgi:hypothetical protein
VRSRIQLSRIRRVFTGQGWCLSVTLSRPSARVRTTKCKVALRGCCSSMWSSGGPCECRQTIVLQHSGRLSHGHRGNAVRPWPQARLRVRVPGRERAGRDDIDDHSRREPVVARPDRMLEPQPVDDPLAVLVKPGRSPQQERRVVVAGDPQLAVGVVALGELDSAAYARQYPVRAWIVGDVRVPGGRRGAAMELRGPHWTFVKVTFCRRRARPPACAWGRCPAMPGAGMRCPAVALR